LVERTRRSNYGEGLRSWGDYCPCSAREGPLSKYLVGIETDNRIPHMVGYEKHWLITGDLAKSSGIGGHGAEG
jgi:hypothetical protein